LQGLPCNEHAEKKQDHIEIDGRKRLVRGYLAGHQDCNGTSKHDLPDSEPEPSDLPDGYKDKYYGQDNQ
jgi:hypothetical protein